MIVAKTCRRQGIVKVRLAKFGSKFDDVDDDLDIVIQNLEIFVQNLDVDIQNLEIFIQNLDVDNRIWMTMKTIWMMLMTKLVEQSGNSFHDWSKKHGTSAGWSP